MGPNTDPKRAQNGPSQNHPKKNDGGVRGGSASPDMVPGAASRACDARGGSFPSCRFLLAPPNTNRLTKSFGGRAGSEQMNIIIQLIMSICSGGYKDVLFGCNKYLTAPP